MLSGAVQWPETLILGLGALFGSYGGTLLGKRLPATIVRIVRITTLILAAVITAVFFLRAYR